MGKKKKIVKRKKFNYELFYQKKFIIYIILFISFIFAILLFDPKLNTGGDNAHYILLGESIIKGKGYCDINHPKAPLHTQYPPGYPLLLGCIMAIAGDNFFLLKVLSFVLSLGTIYVFYLTLKRKKLNILSYSILFLIGIHPLFLTQFHTILTEPPFLFFVILTIYLFQQWEAKKRTSFFILGSLSSIFCYFIKTVGIAMILGVIIYLLYKRNFKKIFVFLLISLIFISPWIIRNSRRPETDRGYAIQFLLKNPYNIESGYINFSDLVKRVYENFRIYGIKIAPTFIFPSYQKLTPSHKPLNLGSIILSLLILGIIIYGLLKTDFKQNITAFFLLFYIPIILGWPCVWSSERFLFPILPFILLFFFYGLSKLIPKVQIISFLCVGISVLTSLQETLPKIPGNLNMLSRYIKGDKMAGYPMDWRNYYTASDWIKENTSSNSIILCRKPNLFYLRANRKCFCYPMTYDHSKILNAIEKADYILLDSFFWTATTRKYLIPVLYENKEKFEVVYATGEPRTFVLKVIK